jgi:AcrR family transcriptional regulator
MEVTTRRRAPRRRTQAERSAATRTDLLRACLHLFARRGFASTSLDDVAAAVGMTKGAIYWHFPSKDALFDALMAYIRSQWRRLVLRPMLADASPDARLRRFFAGYRQLFESEPDECLFLQRVTLDAGTRYVRKVSEVYAQTATVMVAIIEQGKRSGLFRADADARALAYLALASLTGANAHAAVNPRVKLGTLIDEARDALLRHLEAQRR